MGTILKQKQAIVIVGAYSSGYYLAPAFLGRGYQCIHVATIQEEAGNNQSSPFFAKVFTYKDDKLEHIIDGLCEFEIKAVIAASETGVAVADKLAKSFDVAKNPYDERCKRRHKFYMIDALRQANLPCAKQFCSNDLDEIINWYHLNNDKKVVLKPALGALSDGVAVCESVCEIVKVFNKNINCTNFLGEIKDEYVIQEYLEGRHFIINSVSVEGKHFITDVWEDVNRNEGVHLIDEYSLSILRNSNEFKVMQEYIFKALDALDILNGPAHAEVRLTNEGPKLIEVNARLAGGINFSIIEESQGYSQLSVLVDSILHPGLFEEYVQIYEKLPSKQMRFIYMYSDYTGNVVKVPDPQMFMSIRGLMSIKINLELDKELLETKYATGHPGYAMLLGDSTEELEAGYNQFRTLERDFYKNIIGEQE